MLNKHSPIQLTTLSLALICAVSTSGCSSVGEVLSGDKVDYRTSGLKTVNLDIPPDLTQLSGQSRYAQGQSSTVSASSMALPADRTNADQSVALNTPQAGLATIERNGQSRWLSVALPPEKVWDQVKAFWLEAGFELPVEQASVGILETNWSENRAKLPQTGVRKLLGGVLDTLYDTGERDQFRTRIERTAKGCEIYITHRGVMEVYEDLKKDQTKWVGRPVDATLEAEMLSRLMLKLGATKAEAAAAKTTAVAAAPAAPSVPVASRVHLQADGISIAADDNFDTVWRRVGLALDRGGFTIEDRDRTQGTFDIRLAPGSDPTASKPGFWSRMFGTSEIGADGLARYRVQVSSKGASSLIKVSSSKADMGPTDTGRRITKQLLAELN